MSMAYAVTTLPDWGQDHIAYLTLINVECARPPIRIWARNSLRVK